MACQFLTKEIVSQMTLMIKNSKIKIQILFISTETSLIIIIIHKKSYIEAVGFEES